MTLLSGARLGHVAFRARDLEASLAWYARAFGATEAFRARRDDGSTQLVYLELAPGHMIELFPDAKSAVETPADAVGYTHTCLLVDDLDAALAHLTSVGVEPAAPPRLGRAGQKLAFVADLDGNRLELMEIPPGSPIHRPN